MCRGESRRPVPLRAPCGRSHVFVFEEDTAYGFESLCARGLLTVSATLPSGATDGAVELFCLQQRQKQHWAWVGACTEPRLQLIDISRAFQRLHVIAGDFRTEVMLPMGNGPLVREGRSLGLVREGLSRRSLEPLSSWKGPHPAPSASVLWRSARMWWRGSCSF